jgi:hypothetical protein
VVHLVIDGLFDFTEYSSTDVEGQKVGGIVDDGQG